MCVCSGRRYMKFSRDYGNKGFSVWGELSKCVTKESFLYAKTLFLNYNALVEQKHCLLTTLAGLPLMMKRNKVM